MIIYNNYYNNDSHKLLLLWSLPLGGGRKQWKPVGMYGLVETNQVSTNYNDVYNKRMIVIFKICSITIMWMSLWLLINLKYIRVGSSRSQSYTNRSKLERLHQPKLVHMHFTSLLLAWIFWPDSDWLKFWWPWTI